MLKILHTADWHVRDKDISEIEKCLNFVVETAKKEKPDIIIHAGDVYDAAGIKADTLAVKLSFKIIKELADIAPVAIIIGTPSHDGKVAEALEYIDARHNIMVSARPEQIYLEHKPEGTWLADTGSQYTKAVISMCPAPTKQFFGSESGITGTDNEIAQAMSGVFAGFAARAPGYPSCPHILVYHGSIVGATLPNDQVMTGRDVEISREQISLAEVDLVACGHIHLPQKISKNIFYSGSTSAINWGECHGHGFYIHEIAKDKLSSNFIPTPTTNRLKITEDFTKPDSDIDSFLSSLAIGDEILRAVVRFSFKVFHDDKTVDVEKIKSFFMSGGAKDVEVNIIRIPRENTRSKKILMLDRLRDKLVERASLNGENAVPESILAKADMLEDEQPENIVKQVINE